MVDVVIVGAGPSGRALAAACGDTGLDVVLVDPDPRRVWPHTYSAWQDELPISTPVRSIMPTMRAFGTTEHEWNRPYAVLDNTGLTQLLWRDSVTHISGCAVAAEHAPTGSTVILRDGRRIATAAVVDASGASRALRGGRPNRVATAQTAVGAVVDADSARRLCPEGSGIFMDWRPAPDTRGGWPTFLYAVRLDARRTLLEETSLARRPALPLAQLRRRLRGRLAAEDIRIDDTTGEERVRFPLDDPLPRPDRVIAFGASGGLVHPTSGFSVATALRWAPWIASAIAAGLNADPATAARAAHRLLWPPSAVAAHQLRRRALRVLLALPPETVPEFFEVFFSLDPRYRRAMLDPEQTPAGTTNAMTALFREAPWPLRKQLMLAGISFGNRQARHGLGGQ